MIAEQYSESDGGDKRRPERLGTNQISDSAWGMTKTISTRPGTPLGKSETSYKPIRKNLDSVDRGFLGPADGVVGDQGPVGKEVWCQKAKTATKPTPRRIHTCRGPS